MRKTLPYIILLILLAFGVWFFLFRQKSDAFGYNEAGFTIKDTGSIGKVFLANSNGETIKLVRDSGGGWILNDKYPALASRINMLLRTLNQQMPLYPVPENQHNDVVKSLIGNSIKIEVYDRENRKMRVFFVGGEAYKSAGTFMLIEGAEKPYVVQIPGFEGYVTPRYDPELKGWRDRTVFDIAPEHLQQVSVNYLQHPLNSFTFIQKNGKITVTLDSSMMMNDKPLNQRRAQAYLKFFGNMNLEEYVNGQSQLDSMLKAMPKVSTVDVSSDNGFSQHMEVYYFPQTKRSKNMMMDSTQTENNYDADRYYAVINNGKDTVTIQTQMFEKIFRQGYEFMTPDGKR